MVKIMLFEILVGIPILCITLILQIMAAKTQEKPSVFSNESEGTKLVAANTQFSVALLKQLAKETPDNIFMSPASISIAMAMTYLGARGESASELGKVMGFNQVADEDLHRSFSQLREILHKTENKYKLQTANRLFGEKSYTFLEDFLAHTKTHYAAELAAMDFRGNYEGAREEINRWVEEQTEKKIQNLLPSGTLESLTRLVLVNAIYFKGDWENKFDPALTKDADFHISKDEKVTVPMMYKKGKFKYGLLRENHGADLECQAVELPYVDERLSMFVFLPTEEHGVDGLVGKLRADHFTDVEKLFRMRTNDVEVYLPRFKLEQSFGLKETFSAMGLTTIFSESADLSGIDGTRDLFVSKIIHKAFIDVNEEGSEAAAATAVVMMLRSLPRVFEVRADRPFLFMIRDNITRTILFLGKFSKPTGDVQKKQEL